MFQKSITGLTATLALGALIGISSTLAESSWTGVRILPDKGKLRIEINGEFFSNYIYEDVSRPFLYPVVGPSSLPITRNWPMGFKKGEAKDHPHHRSLGWPVPQAQLAPRARSAPPPNPRERRGAAPQSSSRPWWGRPSAGGPRGGGEALPPDPVTWSQRAGRPTPGPSVHQLRRHSPPSTGPAVAHAGPVYRVSHTWAASPAACGRLRAPPQPMQGPH